METLPVRSIFFIPENTGSPTTSTPTLCCRVRRDHFLFQRYFHGFVTQMNRLQFRLHAIRVKRRSVIAPATFIGEGAHTGVLFLAARRTILRRNQHSNTARPYDSLRHAPELRASVFLASSFRSASECAGDLHAEADAEDGGVGILRREGGAGVAHQVGRQGGDSDADYQQSEAAGRCGLAAGSSRAIAA